MTEPMVIPKEGALESALQVAGTTPTAIANTVAAVHGSPSRAYTLAVFASARPIRKDKAARIAAALGYGVGDLFTHLDGADLA